MQEIIGVGVLGKAGCHRAYDCQLIHMLSNVREQFAHRYPAVAVTSKLPRTGESVTVVVELSLLDLHFERLSVLGLQPWLWVPSVDLRRPAVHIEKDDMSALRLKMGRS